MKDTGNTPAMNHPTTYANGTYGIGPDPAREVEIETDEAARDLAGCLGNQCLGEPETPPGFMSNQAIRSRFFGIDSHVQVTWHRNGAGILIFAARDATTGKTLYISGAAVLIGETRVDLETGEVHRGGDVQARLTRRALEILRYLAERPGEIVPRAEIAREIWGLTCRAGGAFDAPWGKLRGAIEPNRRQPIHLVTHRGQGVQLVSVERAI